jgi:hypothetical protein
MIGAKTSVHLDMHKESVWAKWVDLSLRCTVWMAFGGIFLSGSGWLAGAAPAAARVFHVATNGNDAWAGTQATPPAMGANGPFATLGRARDAVRELKRQQGGALAQPVSVILHGGTYPLRETVALSPEDSGTLSCPVEYVAAEGEVPILSGGRRLSGWKPAVVQGRPVWTADLPEVRAGQWFFRQLWVNGERRARARHPNIGYLAVTEVPEEKPNTGWEKGSASFRFKAGDLKAWATVTKAEVCVMNRWVESHLPIMEVDEANRLARFGKRSVFKLDAGDLYYVENALEFLDTPGEWYLDGGAGTLYYLPRPGEEIERAEVIAPVLSELVRFEGRPGEGQFIEHLAFRGVGFAHTEWYFPAGFASGGNRVELWPPPEAAVGGFAQAAVGVPGAVRGEGVRQVLFENCRWLHLGGYGLELTRGCQSNRVSRCELGDLGAGGIKLGETAIRTKPADMARDNEVSDCQIHDGGRFYHSAIGVWVGQAPGTRIVRNHIHDFYYTGISVGWTWGYGQALATNTLVELNHVHHIGQLANGDGPILSDMAGIYTLGLQRGSVIRSNFWHDMAGLRYGGWGIYFDEGTTEILAEKNLVLRTTHGGFHQHYGRDNRVRNNIFVDARDFQIQRSRQESHRSFTFERNIVSWHRGHLLEGNFEGTTNFVFASNLYWPAGGGEVKFWKWPFTEWQQRGFDKDSLVADPKFTDPAAGDYTLRADSPALGLGFQPFDLRHLTDVVRP